MIYLYRARKDPSAALCGSLRPVCVCCRAVTLCGCCACPGRVLAAVVGLSQLAPLHLCPRATDPPHAPPRSPRTPSAALAPALSLSRPLCRSPALPVLRGCLPCPVTLSPSVAHSLPLCASSLGGVGWRACRICSGSGCCLWPVVSVCLGGASVHLLRLFRL